MWWSNAGSLSYIRFIHRRLRIFLARTLRTSIFLLNYGGYSERVPTASNAPRCGMLAAETKTAASSQQPPATDCVACREECSTFDASIIQRKISTTKWSIHIFCMCFIHHPIRTWCISCFNSACVLLFLILPSLVWVAKTSSPSWGQFLSLVQKVNLLFSLGSFLFVVLISSFLFVGLYIYYSCIEQTTPTYYAACEVEYQPCNRSYSQLLKTSL